MLVNPESMPDWIRWTHYLSIFFYAYSALMINEMTGIKIDFAVRHGSREGRVGPFHSCCWLRYHACRGVCQPACPRAACSVR
jgi:hypothetical protein